MRDYTNEIIYLDGKLYKVLKTYEGDDDLSYHGSPWYETFIEAQDLETNEVKTSVLWECGTPMFFPPHLDYVHVQEEDFMTIAPASLFMKYNERHMYEPRNFIDNVRVLLLAQRGAKKVKKNMRKLRKENVPGCRFTEIRIIDLIEK